MGKFGRKRREGPQKEPLPLKRPKLDQSHPRQPVQITIAAVKQQLQAQNLEEKLCALQTIGTYLDSEEFVKLLIESDVVKIMLLLLTDDNSQVRNAVAGTLRNFSTLSLDVCEFLIEQNVMTPLINFFKRYAENWIPIQVQGRLDEDGDTFLQCVYFLWNICESSGDSVKIVNESHILPILIRCLNRQVFGDEMVIAILHFLLVIIEDNPSAVQEIKELCETPLNELISSEDTSPGGILVKTLTTAMLLNLKHSNILSAPIDFLNNILNILVKVLSVDLRELCHKISSNIPLESDNTMDTEIEKEMENLKRLIDAQQTALEIITNMCSPEEEEAMDMDEPSEGDSEMDDDVSSNGNENGSSFVANKLPLEYIEAIASFNTPKIVWDKTSGLAENVTQILNESKNGKFILNRYQILQSRALLCMNNFIENLPIENLVGYENIYRIWIESGNIVFKGSQYTNNAQILESAAFVMRAALNKLKSDLFQSRGSTDITNLFNGLSTNDLKDIFDGINKCENSETRVNLLRMLGNLALILNSKSPVDPSDVEIYIATFLIDRIGKETEVWLLAELLDIVMDLFSEDETDKLAFKVNLIGKLNEIAPIIKRKVKQQKKTLGDHIAVVSTVTMNLPRFIKYKSRRMEILVK